MMYGVLMKMSPRTRSYSINSAHSTLLSVWCSEYALADPLSVTERKDIHHIPYGRGTIVYR